MKQSLESSLKNLRLAKSLKLGGLAPDDAIIRQLKKEVEQFHHGDITEKRFCKNAQNILR